MIIQLPVTSDPAQDFVIALGPATWELYVRFNERQKVWTMDITDYNTKTALVTGMPIVLGCDLLDPYNLENGAMIALDSTGSGTDAGPEALGDRVQVYWISQDQAELIQEQKI